MKDAAMSSKDQRHKSTVMEELWKQFKSIAEKISFTFLLSFVLLFLFVIFDNILFFDTFAFHESVLDMALPFVIFFVPSWFVVSRLLNQKRTIDIQNSLHDRIIGVLIYQFRLRALRLRRLSYFLLFTIFSIIMIGSMIFNWAENVTYNINDRYFEFLQRRLLDIRDNIRSLERNMPGSFSDDTSKKEYDQRLLDAKSEETRLTNTITGLIRQDEEPSWRWFTTLSIRTGSVLLLIFLVQILINLYRYYLRLSFFYDSRADFLQLFGVSDELTAETLAKIVNTDQFEFGRPRTPVEQLVNMVKELPGVNARNLK